MAEPTQRSRGDRRAGRARGRLIERVDATTSLVLTLPVFVAYELGLLVSDRANGADFITRTIIQLFRLDRQRYILFNVGLLILLLVTIFILRRRNQFHLRSFLPLLVESAIYAATMGTAILLVMRYVLRADLWAGRAAMALVDGGVLAIGPPLPLLVGTEKLSLLDKVVISLGAGFHEELVFRLIGLGGIALICTSVLKWRPAAAFLAAYLISSVLFSAAHYVGPAGEAFSMTTFIYRFLAGLIFGLIYQFRGFATAVYTHTLYDLYVFVLR